MSTTDCIKSCYACGLEKPFTADYFYARRGKLRTPCKDCHNQAVSSSRAADPDKVRDRLKKYRASAQGKKRMREYAREYRVRNKDRLNLMNLQWRRSNPDRVRESYLRTRYGISKADYDSLLALQGGVCAICKLPEEMIDPQTVKTKRLAVDHDHVSGKVRGLLCRKCNALIGLAHDSRDLLSSAIAYLSSVCTST